MLRVLLIRNGARYAFYGDSDVSLPRNDYRVHLTSQNWCFLRYRRNVFGAEAFRHIRFEDLSSQSQPRRICSGGTLVNWISLRLFTGSRVLQSIFSPALTRIRQ